MSTLAVLSGVNKTTRGLGSTKKSDCVPSPKTTEEKLQYSAQANKQLQAEYSNLEQVNKLQQDKQQAEQATQKIAYQEEQLKAVRLAANLTSQKARNAIQQLQNARLATNLTSQQLENARLNAENARLSANISAQAAADAKKETEAEKSQSNIVIICAAVFTSVLLVGGFFLNKLRRRALKAEGLLQEQVAQQEHEICYWYLDRAVALDVASRVCCICVLCMRVSYLVLSGL